MAQGCIHKPILPIDVALRVVVAYGEDSGSTTIGAASRIRQIRMAIRVAVLRCRLTGRGAVVSIAANGGCGAPHHLTKMTPILEIRPVRRSLAVRQGVVLNFVVVQQISN